MMRSAEAIMSKAISQHKPSLIVCSYSGGYDSMVATHKALIWAKAYAHSTNIITVAIDTKIHAEGWLEYIHASANQLGANRFEVWQTGMLDKWIADVKDRGFAYRKAQHKIYFYYLKQNAFRAVVAHYKKHYFDRIMFITGIRRQESKERANTPEYEQIGANVWCHPLVNWSEQDVHMYRLEHNLPENPFYAITNNSGDCLCNWHNRIKLASVTGATREIIEPLDIECRAKFGYGYDDEPSKLKQQELAGQLPLGLVFDDTPYLCASCEGKQATNEDMENVLMQRIAW